MAKPPIGKAGRKERRRRQKMSKGARAAALAPAAPGRDQALRDAVALHGAGRLAEAAQCLSDALAGDDAWADGHYNLGVLNQALGRPDDAGRAYAAAIAADAGHVGAHLNLGVLLQSAGDLSAAEAAYRQALALDPAIAEAHLNLGLVLRDRGHADDAIKSLRRALDLRPDYVEALNALGVTLQAHGDGAAAVTTLARALEIRPDMAEAWNNLATVHHKQGNLDAAIDHFRKAIGLQPDYAEAHRNFSHVLMLAGRLAEAWPEFEWRWKCADFPSERRPFTQPSWAGEPVSGKTVLVWGEQGVGDEVQFAGMVPDLIDAGARVVLESDARLVPLFARSFPAATCIPRHTPPAPEAAAAAVDFQIPGGNLGRWLRPDDDAFPKRDAYLAADAGRAKALGETYRDGGTDMLVGIAWISKNPEVGRDKSMALADWRPIGQVPGVRLIDLQYGDTRAEREAFEAESGVAVIRDDSIDQLADLDAFAAQVAAMDLVISVSNTTVHIAGALGVPTWVMLHALPLPVWRTTGDTSPWYPSLSLYRQGVLGRWSDVITRVTDALTRHAGQG